MQIRSLEVKMLVDFGALVSVLNLNTVNSIHPRPYLEKSTLRLTTYTREPIRQLGIANLPVTMDQQHIDSFRFHFVKVGSNVMGVDLFDALGFGINLAQGTHLVQILQASSFKRLLLAHYPTLCTSEP